MKRAIELFRRYLTVERDCSPHTVRGYLSDLGQFHEYLAGREPFRGKRVQISRITPFHIRGFLSERHGREKPSSLQRKMASIRSFFTFLNRKGLFKGNPGLAISSPKVPKSLPRSLTVDEVLSILDLLKGLDMTLLKRDRAILEFLYSTGIRVGELVKLDLKEIDMAEMTVRIMGKGRKERIVPFGSKAREALFGYMEVRGSLLSRKKGDRAGEAGRDALFLNWRGGRLSDRAVRMMVRKYSLLSGILKEVSPHTLRHSFATHLLGGGGGSAQHTGTPGAFEPFHHPEIYLGKYREYPEDIR